MLWFQAELLAIKSHWPICPWSLAWRIWNPLQLLVEQNPKLKTDIFCHEWTNCISRYCKVSLSVVHHIAFHGLEPLSRQKSASQEDSYMKSLAGFSYYRYSSSIALTCLLYPISSYPSRSCFLLSYSHTGGAGTPGLSHLTLSCFIFTPLIQALSLTVSCAIFFHLIISSKLILSHLNLSQAQLILSYLILSKRSPHPLCSKPGPEPRIWNISVHFAAWGHLDHTWSVQFCTPFCSYTKLNG